MPQTQGAGLGWLTCAMGLYRHVGLETQPLARRRWMQLDLRGAAEQSDSRPDHLILRPLTTVKVSNTMEMNMRGYRLISLFSPELT